MALPYSVAEQKRKKIGLLFCRKKTPHDFRVGEIENKEGRAVCCKKKVLPPKEAPGGSTESDGGSRALRLGERVSLHPMGGAWSIRRVYGSKRNLGEKRREGKGARSLCEGEKEGGPNIVGSGGRIAATPSKKKKKKRALPAQEKRGSTPAN